MNTGHLALGRGGGEASSDEEEEEEENGGEQGAGEPLPVPSPRYCSKAVVSVGCLEIRFCHRASLKSVLAIGFRLTMCL